MAMIALALKHACEDSSSTGVEPMEEILWRYSTSRCTDIFLSILVQKNVSGARGRGCTLQVGCQQEEAL